MLCLLNIALLLQKYSENVDFPVCEGCAVAAINVELGVPGYTFNDSYANGIRFGFDNHLGPKGLRRERVLSGSKFSMEREHCGNPEDYDAGVLVGIRVVELCNGN